MPKARTYAVNPEVLIWARERLGLSTEQAADLLGTSAEELASIEAGAIPRVTLLERAATRYQISLATLVAPQPPRNYRRPRDYRTVGGKAAQLSSATLLAMHEVQFYRHEVLDLVQSLVDSGETEPSALPRVTRRDDPSEVASIERTRLGVEFKDQLNWRSAKEAFSGWRWHVEQQGVFVLLKRMPRDDCSGFSFSDDDLPPTIVVNSTETGQARQFTLFHEYYHLLLRSSGICNERIDVDGHRDERLCNRFAAAMLMPKDLVVAQARNISYRSAARTHLWSRQDVERLASRLKVGRPAMAIRLEELGLASSGMAARFVAQWSAMSSEDTWIEREQEEEKRELRIPVANKALSNWGSGYAGLVFSGLDAGIIDQRDAAQLLNTGTKHFDAIRQRLVRRQEVYA